MFETREERDRKRNYNVERKVAGALANGDYDLVKHWVATGYISRAYAIQIHDRVKKGWAGGYGRDAKVVNGRFINSNIPNPCGEIPLVESKVEFKHPTEKVNRKMLLIG